MSDAAAPPPSAPPRPRRRGRRALLVLGVLLAGLGVAHGPLLRTVTDWAARRAAKQAGLTLAWELTGNPVSGFEIRHLRLTGTSNTVVQSVIAARAAAAYSPWRLWREGAGSFVRSLDLQDARVELDLRRAAPDPDPNPARSKREEGSRPPDLWIGRLTVSNLTVILHQSNGTLAVERAGLTLAENEAGELTVERLALPRGPTFTGLSAGTLLTNRTLCVTQLRGLPGLAVSQFAAGVGRLSTGHLPFGLEAGLAGGGVRLQGELAWPDAQMVLSAEGTLTNLTLEALPPWAALPEGVTGTLSAATLRVLGPPDTPRGLQLNTTVHLTNAAASGVRLDDARWHAEASRGRVVVRLNLAQAPSNQVELVATADLPPRWSDTNAWRATVGGRATLARLGTCVPPGGPDGAVQAGFRVEWSAAGLSNLTADASGTNLLWQGLAIPSVLLSASGDDRRVVLDRVFAFLSDSNWVSATGSWSPRGRQPAAVSWTAQLDDLGAFAAWSGFTQRPGPAAGRLRSSGAVEFAVADLVSTNYANAIGLAGADLSGVRWGDAVLGEARLGVQVGGGVARVVSGSVRWDATNAADLAGSVRLAPPWPAEGAARVALNDLARLSAWSTTFGGPPLGGGRLRASWTGHASPGAPASGAVQAELDAAVVGTNLAPVSLRLDATHEGLAAELSRCEVSSGPWHLAARARVTPTNAAIETLELRHGTNRVLTGRASLPLDRAAPGVPVSDTRPLSVRLEVPRLDLDSLPDLAGRPLPVRGAASASITLDGTLRAPQGGVILRGERLQARAAGDRFDPAALSADLAAEGDRWTLNVTAQQPPLRPLTIVATLTQSLAALVRQPSGLSNAPVVARLVLPPSDLAALPRWVPAVKSITGQASLDASLRGTLGLPLWEGQLRCDIPRLVPAGPTAPEARHVTGRIRFDERHVRVDNLSAQVSGGALGATGDIDVTSRTNPVLNLRVTAREALVVRDESMTCRANAALTCVGPWNAATVAGRVELVRGRVFKEVEFLPLSLPGRQLPPPPPAARAAPALPPPFDRWTWNVDVVTRDPIRLLGNVLNGGVVVNVRARGSGALPQVEGEVSLDGARVRLPYSRLNIVRGVLTFPPANPLDPQLDLRGEAFTGGRDVTVYVFGPVSQLRTRLISNPPLSEGDIATLLATGATSGDLASGEAANKAAFLALSRLYRKLLGRSQVGASDAEPPRLSFNVSLFNTTSTKRGVSAVYEVSPRVQAVGTVQDTGGFRGVLYYLVRFR